MIKEVKIHEFAGQEKFNIGLVESAMRDQFDRVKYYVEQGANINARPHNDESTALIWAAYNGNTEMVEYLIQHGADTEIKDLPKHTALLWAAKRGHADTCKALIKANADIHAKVAGDSAFTLAYRDSHMDVVKVIIDAKFHLGNDIKEDKDYLWVKNYSYDDAIALFEQAELDYIANNKIENNITTL